MAFIKNEKTKLTKKRIAKRETNLKKLGLKDIEIHHYENDMPVSWKDYLEW